MCGEQNKLLVAGLQTDYIGVYSSVMQATRSAIVLAFKSDLSGVVPFLTSGQGE